MEKPSPPTPTTSPPTPKPRLTICPYCGSQTRSHTACEGCRGKFDPLSRQATQNAMGPWFVRDEANPHRPGCSYGTLIGLIERGGVTADTVLRGPSSRQFWTLARWCPGIAHRLGVCHSCQQPAQPKETDCGHCGASFRVAGERQRLGLGEVRQLPGQHSPVVQAGASAAGSLAQEAVAHGTVSAAIAGHAVAGQAVSAQGQTHEQLESGAAERNPEPTVDPRYLRLERELRHSRRWRTLWAVGFSFVVLVVAGVFVVRALDLDAGPMGKWLNARGQGVPSVGDVGGVGDAAAGVTPIATTGLTPSKQDAAATEPSEPSAHPAEAAPDAVPSDRERPETCLVSPSDPVDQESRARLDTLALLRRLR